MSKVATQEDANSLSEFSWDDGSDVFASFSDNKDTDETEEQKELVKAVKTAKVTPKKEDASDDDDDDDDSEEDKKPAKAAKPKKDDEDVFSEFSDNAEETPKPKPVKAKADKDADDTPAGDDDDDDDEDDEDVKLFTSLATDLSEKGVFSNVKIAKGEKLTEEKFFDKLEEEVDSRVDETFNGFFDELKQDPDALAFIKFKRDGGNTRDFFKAYTQSPVNHIPEDIDLDEIKNQRLVAKAYLQSYDELEGEELEEKMEWLEERGKLEDNAKKWHAKMLKADENAKKAMIANQQKAKEQMVQSQLEFKQALEKTLSEVEEVGNFKFTDKDKKSLIPFITKADVKVGDNRFISKFQAKMGEIMKDKPKLLLLAKLLEQDFDTSDLITDLTTKVTRQAKSTLREVSKNKKLSGGATSGRGRSLADFF